MTVDWERYTFPHQAAGKRLTDIKIYTSDIKPKVSNMDRLDPERGKK